MDKSISAQTKLIIRPASYRQIKHQLLSLVQYINEDTFPGLEDYHARPITPEHVRDYLRDGLRRLADVVATVQSLTREGDAVADIGISYGFYSIVLKESLGVKVWGTEVEENISTYCALCGRFGIAVRPFNLVTGLPPFPEGQMNGVILSEVIEHLRADPVVAICKCACLLKPGGWVLLATPNVARLANVLRLLLCRNIYESFGTPRETPQPPVSSQFDYRAHVREYTVREVLDLIRRAGLRLEWVRTKNLRRPLLTTCKLPDTPIRRLMNSLVHLGATPLKPYRDTIIAVARRDTSWSPPIWARKRVGQLKTKEVEEL